jgi:hypothetical protein
MIADVGHTEFILHVGPHKTGTTYIQTNLSRHRSVLLAKGILYPTQGTDTANPHCQALLSRCLARQDFASARAILDAVPRRSATKVVLSCEDMIELSDQAFLFLADMTGPNNRVVFYYRPWPARLPSGWQEMLRKGGKATFPEYLAKHFQHPEHSGAINQHAVLDRLARSFGRERVEVVIFNEAVRQDLFVHFVRHVLGGPDSLQPDPVATYASSSPVEAELMRVRNILLPEECRAPGAAFPSSHPDLSRLLESHVQTITLNDNRLPWRHYLDRLNDDYGDRVLRPRQQDRPFRPHQQQAKYVNPDYLLHPDVQRLLREATLPLNVDKAA